MTLSLLIIIHLRSINELYYKLKKHNHEKRYHFRVIF